MTLQINMRPGEAANGDPGTGIMTSAGNPWSVSDGLAQDLVQRGKAVAFNWPSSPVTVPIESSVAADLALRLPVAYSQVRLATFGDSTANLGATTSDGTAFGATTDASISGPMPAAASGNIQTYPFQERSLVQTFYPGGNLVGIGGISGQTTTQMLARDTLAAAATRRSISDVLDLAPDAVLLRGGSINDLSALTAAQLTQSAIDTVFAQHMSIVSQLLAGGAWVVDSGFFGYDGSATPAADLAARRAALLQLNQRFKAAATGRHRFVDCSYVTLDPTTGAYLPNMSQDGTHLNLYGGYKHGRAEASVLAAIFGASAPNGYRGVNRMANAQFAQVSVASFGNYPTGHTLGGTNATLSGGAIVARNGKPYAQVVVTPTSSTPSVNVLIPWPIYNGSTYTVAAGEVYGIELDYFVEPVNAGDVLTQAQSGGSYFRAQLFKPATPCRMIAGAALDTYGFSFAEPLDVHIQLPRWTMPEASAALNSSTQWSLNIALSGTAPFRVGYSSPRFVKLA